MGGLIFTAATQAEADKLVAIDANAQVFDTEAAARVAVENISADVSLTNEAMRIIKKSRLLND